MNDVTTIIESDLHRLFPSFVLEVQGSRNPSRDIGNVLRVPEQTYWNQSAPIDDRTVCTVAERLAEYSRRHAIDRVELVLRGGEPLLIGLSGLRWIFHTFRSAMDGIAEIDLRLQTGGGGLDERFAELFLATGVQVGIALPGGLGTGESSYDGTLRAVRLLGSSDYRPAFGGVLCTLDVANDPVRVFEDLAELDPPTIDLVLPRASWEHPPPEAVIGRTPYGDWLVALFDHWYDTPPKIGIRLFEQVMHALLRGVAPADVVRSAVPDRIVIDAEGSIQRTDSLAAAFELAGPRGYDVVQHSLDDVLDQLSAENPSVYARDLTRLIGHIQHRLATDLSAQPELLDIR